MAKSVRELELIIMRLKSQLEAKDEQIKGMDKYIREGIEPDPETKARIDRLHNINLFKLRYMDTFSFEG